MEARMIVDVGDMKAAAGEGSLITYALGSCIGVSIYDPGARLGALLHFMLPDSRIDARKAVEKPFMFADTGIARTFEHLQQLGGRPQRCTVKAAGGSNIMDPNNMFNIGKNNYLALKKVLWRFNVLVKAEDVGGTVSRTMTLCVATGAVLLRYAGTPQEALL